MGFYGTELYAKCPLTGDIKRYMGPLIEADSQELAEVYCQENGLGYLTVLGLKIDKPPSCFDDINIVSEGDN